MSACLIRVRGLVQGVGFRPQVWRLATRLGLSGWVKNDAEGVLIAVGDGAEALIAELATAPPPLARIDSMATVDGIISPAITPGRFLILDSTGGDVHTAIGPDAALCPACAAEIIDPAQRRWRYAFTTCTHCGPRYTVSRQLPYDRSRTSLAEFPLCPTCDAEYHDPADRRFHAETTCCPTCGPKLALLDAQGQPLPGDPLSATVDLLRAGKIVAIKGLGGFHLACDARQPAAVAELRQRKQREEKPFAIMGLNPASLAPYARIGAAESALLNSPSAPIVLCAQGAELLPGIAPGLSTLGLMLPGTPLHLLLWHEAAGRPANPDWRQQAHPLLLVMTSANPHGEPLVIDNDEALSRLAGIADAFLGHDRPILTRCDDSLLRPTAQGPAFIRRARGYTPLPVALADDGPSVLALGGFQKNTICLIRGREAFLSQHIGSLDNAATVGFLEDSVHHLLAILEQRPQYIAHDLHPDFPSTRLAARLAAEWQIPAIGIGHHHAHIGAILAEQQINEPVIGLAIDGTGLGPDGGLWGGELLYVDGARSSRIGDLHPLALPGGDRAAREPWRMAIAALHGAGLGHRVGGWLKARYPERDAGPLLTMLARKLRCPPTSSLGRLFDAAAGLLGVRAEAHYEGQAAMELEALAQRHGPVPPLPGGFQIQYSNGHSQLDFAPLIAALLDCPDAAYGAALFHSTLAEGLGVWLRDAIARFPALDKIAIGGGCAMNTRLMSDLVAHLQQAGVSVLEARQVPPNDGGLALGQAWLARLMSKEN